MRLGFGPWASLAAVTVYGEDMLIDCPECSKRVSDRAASCPDCGFPIAEELAATRAAAELAAERTTRKLVGETDCLACTARGFTTHKEVDDERGEIDTFAWCSICERTGRVRLVQSSRGFYAVAPDRLEAFLKSTTEDTDAYGTFVGDEKPEHRYPNNPNRWQS